VQISTEAAPRTDAKQIFGASIEIHQRAIRIDNEYGRVETTENVSRRWCRIGASARS
jgi:hypothetical protein